MRVSPSLVLPFVASLAPGAALAQEPQRPVPLLVPGDCQLRLSLTGLPTMRRIHEKDPLGRALASPAVAQFAKEVTAAFGKIVGSPDLKLPEDAPITEAQLRALPGVVAGFDGALELGLHLGDKARGKIVPLTPDDLGFVLQLVPSRPMDFGPVTALVDKLLEDLPDLQWRDVAAGDLKVKVATFTLPQGARFEVARPFVHEGQLTFAAAGNIERWLERLQRGGGKDEESGGPLRECSSYAHLDPLALVGLVPAVMQWTGAEKAEEVSGFLGMLATLELECVRRIWGRAYSRDGHQVSDTGISFAGGPRGLLAALVPAAPGVSSLQRFVPRNVFSSSLCHLDLGRLYTSLQPLLAAVGPGIDVDEMFRDKTGLRLAQDVLAHLGTDAMKLEHVNVENLAEIEDDRAFEHDGTCYAMSLRDSAAFGRSLEQLVRKMGLHVTRKKAAYREHTIYTIRHGLFPLSVHYVVGEPLFALAFGETGATTIRALVDEVAGAAQGRQQVLPAPLARQVALVKPGYYALGHANLSEISGLLRAAIDEVAVEDFASDPDATALDRSLRSLLGSTSRFLKTFDIGKDRTVLSVTRYTGDGILARDIW